ncbi:hypothetical protein [Gorillibacterium timonense]|uniref:hypothetical protein n=1 Tax=Gorillibacterium timonense TaxID=1689269 RepID=UPI00071C3C4D|nr:hypothetical protein [Gorillibacterium timonense]
MRSMKALFCAILAFGLFFVAARPAHALSVVHAYNSPIELTIQPNEVRPVLFVPPGGHPLAVTVTISQIGTVSTGLGGYAALLRDGKELAQMKTVTGVASQSINYAYWYVDPALTDLLILRNDGTTPIKVRVTFTGHFSS